MYEAISWNIDTGGTLVQINVDRQKRGMEGSNFNVNISDTAGRGVYFAANAKDLRAMASLFNLMAGAEGS